MKTNRYTLVMDQSEQDRFFDILHSFGAPYNRISFINIPEEVHITLSLTEEELTVIKLSIPLLHYYIKQDDPTYYYPF